MALKNLYVGNLSYSTNEEGLLMAFGEFQPQNAKIIPNRGFGFVEVPEELMEAAITKMDGATVDGRTLKVNEARPKEDRPRFGGGGGGGYSGGGGRPGGGGGGYGGGRPGGGGGGYGGGRPGGGGGGGGRDRDRRGGGRDRY